MSCAEPVLVSAAGRFLAASLAVGVVSTGADMVMIEMEGERSDGVLLMSCPHDVRSSTSYRILVATDAEEPTHIDNLLVYKIHQNLSTYTLQYV